MKKKYALKLSKTIIILSLGFFSKSYADSAPLSYKTSDGKTLVTTITSDLKSDGTPVVTAYRDGNGEWKKTTVTQQICGVDSSGSPIACPAPALLLSDTLKNYIPASAINQASGVAGLNVNNSLTAPLETPGSLIAQGLIQFGKAPSSKPNIVQGIPTSWDGAILPSTLVIGGIGKGDAAPVKITTPLIGHGDWAGCVLNVQDASFEQFARCGAGLDDGVVGMFKTVNSTALLEAGTDIASASGTHYAVTLAGQSITLRPMLTAEDAALVYPRARIYTNWRNGMQDTAPTSTNTPALWYGYVGTLTNGTDATGSYTQISILSNPDTWQIGWTKNDGTVTTTSPGQNDGDIRDTFVSQYSTDAVFIGQAGKKFVFNTMIQLDPTVKNSPTRAAEGEELDLQLLDPDGWHQHDGFFTVHGKTIALTGKDNSAADSYLERLAGANLVQTGLSVDGILYGGRVIRTDAGFQFYSQGDLNTLNVGESAQVSQLGSLNISGQFISLLLYGSKDTEQSANNGWGAGSLHLGAQEKQDAGVMSGTAPGCSSCTGGGQIVWDPPGHHYGIGFGTGFANSVQYGLYIDNGKPSFPSGVTVSQGSELAFLPADNSANEHPVLMAIDSTHLSLSSSAGSLTSLTTGTISAQKFHETLNTPLSSTTDCTAGDFTDDVNYHYVCVTTNHWKRAALSDF